MDATESKRDATSGWNRPPREWAVLILFIVLLVWAWVSWSSSTQSLESAARALRRLPSVKALGPEGDQFIAGVVRNFELGWAMPFAVLVGLGLWEVALLSYNRKLEASPTDCALLREAVPGRFPMPKVRLPYLWCASNLVVSGLVASALLVAFSARHQPLTGLVPADDSQLQGLAQFLDQASEGAAGSSWLGFVAFLSAASAYGALKMLHSRAAVLQGFARQMAGQADEGAGEAAPASS